MRTGFSQRQLMRHGIRLHEVYKILKAEGITKVLDLGCGDGQLLEILAEDQQFTKLIGIDIDKAALDEISGHLKKARVADTDSRVELIHGSILDVNQNYAVDAVVLVDVIEHLPVNDLFNLEKVIFTVQKPKLVVITTPEVKETMQAVHYSHPEHEFEWSADQARAWGTQIGQRYGYRYKHSLINTYPLAGKDIQLLVFY